MIDIEQAKRLLDQMTLTEKAELCSSQNMWETRENRRLKIPKVVVSDGPHGLRKQSPDVTAAERGSEPAVCYPTASATACSFDEELLTEIGESLGEEALHKGVDVVLGPGVNHKRSPLCGRNFEYFSEDPYLSGKLGAAWINGVQSRGAGASLKHFALNSQETHRESVSSNADDRTFFEIYLAAFETAIREARPWAVMSSYNRIDGTFSCENERLQRQIGRGKFGFEGAYISDWGGVSSVTQSFKNGLNIEFPSFCDGTTARIVEAVKTGILTEAELNEAALPVVMLALKSAEKTRYAFDAKESFAEKTIDTKNSYTENTIDIKNNADQKTHYPFDTDGALRLAQRAAEECAVLLKNAGGILPVKAGATVALLGAFAKTPRYQGAGSSLVNPVVLDNAFDALTAAGLTFDYADGYDVKSGETDERLLAAAVAAARNKDVVLIYAGLPDGAESEGLDRRDIEMPSGHNRLIEAVAAINSNVVVVLQCGSAVAMPWVDKARGILLTYLSGCKGGEASVSLLTGKCNPCGKLAETFPLRLSDTPCYNFYLKNDLNADYAETIYTGYRYYDSAKKEVLFPFGHGLSYTNFEYSALSVGQETFTAGGRLTVRLTVKNIGAADGKEIVQLYIKQKNPQIYKADKELKGCKKVFLRAGEEQAVELTLDDGAFRFFNAQIDDWDILSGEYEILVGRSSRDIALSQCIRVNNPNQNALPDYQKIAPSYYKISDNNFNIDEFYRLSPPAPPIKLTKPFTRNTPVGMLGATLCGKIVQKLMYRQYNKITAQDDFDNLKWLPVRFIPMGAKEISKDLVDIIILVANGRIFRALFAFCKMRNRLKKEKRAAEKD